MILPSDGGHMAHMRVAAPPAVTWASGPVAAVVQPVMFWMPMSNYVWPEALRDNQEGMVHQEPAWSTVAAVTTLGAGALRRRRRQRAAARQALAAKPKAKAKVARVTELQDEAPPGSVDSGSAGSAPASTVGEEVCAELMALLDQGGKARSDAITAIQSSALEFSFDSLACRVVQHAFVVATRGEAVTLVRALYGHVREAVHSQHANHVLQKIVVVMPMSHVEFLAEELAGAGIETARHRFGCRVLCRLLEHHPCEGDVGPTFNLLQEVLGNAAQLSCHAFAHHVIECAIEHGDAHQRHWIATALQVNILRTARNRHGSHVVRKSLVFCSTEDQRALVDAMLTDPDNILSLAENESGCFVARAVLRFPTESSRLALDRLQRAVEEKQTTKKARRIFNEIQNPGKKD